MQKCRKLSDAFQFDFTPLLFLNWMVLNSFVYLCERQQARLPSASSTQQFSTNISLRSLGGDELEEGPTKPWNPVRTQWCEEPSSTLDHPFHDETWALSDDRLLGGSTTLQCSHMPPFQGHESQLHLSCHPAPNNTNNINEQMSKWTNEQMNCKAAKTIAVRNDMRVSLIEVAVRLYQNMGPGNKRQRGLAFLHARCLEPRLDARCSLSLYFSHHGCIWWKGWLAAPSTQ